MARLERAVACRTAFGQAFVRSGSIALNIILAFAEFIISSLRIMLCKSKTGSKRWLAAKCLPSQRSLAGGIERECVPLYNQAAQTLNSELQMEIQRLNRTLPGSRIVYIDIYTPLLDMIQRPYVYGNMVNLTFKASLHALHRTAKIIYFVSVHVHFIFLTLSKALELHLEGTHKKW